MRLLKLDSEGEFTLTPDLHRGAVPRYAALSHTWGPDEEELMYEDVINGRGKNKSGYEKVRFCARQASKDGLDHFWADTCCINRANLVELSESINSMFRWYREAEKCYVYLSDLSTRKRDHEGNSRPVWEAGFRSCRWLTRGWTLQELLAPAVVEFYSREGEFIGDRKELGPVLEEVTGIPSHALAGTVPLSEYSVRERMRWAASRRTTKVEDKVYCLLGIFAVFMSPIYGEGEDHALGRLKEAIAKNYNNRLDEIGLSFDTTESFASTNAASEGMASSQHRYRDLLASLRFDQMDSRRTGIKTAYSSTCTWLLQTPAYLQWADPKHFEQHRGLMWIKGKPGAGKSTLVKFALGHAVKNQSKGEILLSFFFNARGDSLEKTTIGMYRSLLWQLLDKAKDTRSVFDTLPESFQAASSTWTIEMLRELFTSAVGQLGKRTVKCFVDALDECKEVEVRDMIIHLEDLGQMSDGQFSVCFASRHYPTIVVRHGVQLILEEETGHDSDLTKYLQSHLRIDRGDLFDDILARTLEKANGVFMWAVLVTPILNDEYRRGRSFAVAKRLDEIPEGLSELFKDILSRDSTNMDTLLLCLQWVLFARTPLTREEFYFAMLAGSGSDAESLTVWNQRLVTEHDMDRFVHDSSKGLAELTKPAKSTEPVTSTRPRDKRRITDAAVRVQFIHESVRDFLIKDGGLCELWPELGTDPVSLSHEVLKLCCKNGLSVDLAGHSLLITRKSPVDEQLMLRLQTKLPFLRYATQQIFYHADQAAEAVVQDEFLKNFTIQPWANIWNLFAVALVDRYSHDPNLLYILADNDSPRLIRAALRLGLPSHSPHERYQWPFYAALVHKYWGSVRALIDPTGDPSDLDDVVDLLKSQSWSKKVRRVPPLLWALQEGIEPLAEYLAITASHKEINAADHHRRTPLSWAAARGYERMVDRLLPSTLGSSDLADSTNSSPLYYAALHGHTSTCEALLRKGADVLGGFPKVLEDRRVTSPLNIAIKSGHVDTVKLLLQWIPDIDNMLVVTPPLIEAVRAGHAQIVQLLLEHGADPNYTPNISLIREQTPLGLAVCAGHLGITKLLYSAGCREVTLDGSVSTALHVAVSHRRVEIVRFLLDQGEPIDARDGTGNSPLHEAALQGYYEIAKLLLERGATLDSKNSAGQTAAYEAASRDHIEILELFAIHDSVVDTRELISNRR